MIELKDILHYYIGAVCKIPDGQVGKLFGVNGLKAELHLDKGYAAILYKHVKPILRRLEDMTDDDIKSFIMWDKLVEMYVDVSFEKCVDGIVVYYGIDCGADFGGVHSTTHKITFHAFSPKEWVYLMSKGFDLFNLIETGQAIDSKTINNGTERKDH